MCSGSSGGTKALSGLMKPIGAVETPGVSGVFEEGYKKSSAAQYPAALSMQQWIAETKRRQLTYSDTQGRML